MLDLESVTVTIEECFAEGTIVKCSEVGEYQCLAKSKKYFTVEQPREGQQLSAVARQMMDVESLHFKWPIATAKEVDYQIVVEEVLPLENWLSVVEDSGLIGSKY